MKTIDLADFGFPGSTFSYHGEIISRRQDGGRLLFRFNEVHTDREVVRFNIMNALELWGLGILGCVGVEEYPYYFSEWNQSNIEKESARRYSEHHDDDGVIRSSLDESSRSFYFGKTLKLLRPGIHSTMKEESIKWQDWCAPLRPCQEAMARVERAFEDHPLNLRRDAVFVKKILAFWGSKDPHKAAILNAGSAHQNRIVQRLAPDIRYIQIEVPHSHGRG
jgi:hypothetical protein